MRILVDTHTFLWYCQDSPELAPSAKTLIVDRRNLKLVSMVTCWEIAIKAGSGRLQLGDPAQPCATYIPEVLDRTGFTLLPIELEHTIEVASLPLHHRDPFDRMMIAQAIVLNVPIISIDKKFDAYPVTRLW